mgnify:CR=1 FL=1
MLNKKFERPVHCLTSHCDPRTCVSAKYCTTHHREKKVFRIYFILFFSLIFLSMNYHSRMKWEAASTVVIPDDGGLTTAIAYVSKSAQSSHYEEFVEILSVIELPPTFDERRG